MTSPRERVRVATFGGASALPVLVAERVGAFATRGIEVEQTRTADSGSLRDGLADGSLDIVHAAPDNVIAWRDGRGLEARAWLAGSSGPIALVARDATAVAGLRGGRIGVDAVQGGFAPILRRLLQAGGLADRDVELVPMGATRLRYVALMDRDVAATMLTLPWSQLAQERGASILADHRDVAPDLLTSCAISTEPWLRTNAEVAGAYAEAIDAAVAWLRRGEDAGTAVAVLAEDMGVPEASAASVLTTMREPVTGWPERSRLRGDELGPTCELRAATLGPPALPPEAYVHVLDGP
jgi:ABC-type nitrate/sulfonate/bicarbonate transport system substrate-binding protein